MKPPPMTAEEDEIAHVKNVIHGDLALCVCGQSEAALGLIRDVLALCPLYENARWKKVEKVAGSAGAAHMVLSQLTNANLIEHGGSIGGSWLTPHGEWLRDILVRYPTDDDIADLDGQFDFAGIPHDGSPCTKACGPMRGKQ